MSDHLMTRLREEGLGFGIGPAVLCQEAAAEIDRLTFALSDARMEIATLRDALEEIANSDDIDNALDPERNKRVARAALAKAKQP